MNGETLAKIIDNKIHLNLEIDKDERFWEQRMRTNWLKVGDKNSTFFHKYASVRRSRNRILSLQSNEGKETAEESELHSIARGYFMDLFLYEGR